MESDDDTEVPVHFQKAKDIEFEKNKAGEFILPPLLKSSLALVRGRGWFSKYIGVVYRQYLSNPSVFLYADNNFRRVYWEQKSRIPIHCCC